MIGTEGRQTHYHGPKEMAPLMNWMGLYGDFWRDRFDDLENLLDRMDP